MSSAPQLPSTVLQILWVLGLMGGCPAVGKFLDWYIGKPGQAKVKDWLLRGWTKFDDMNWYNFSGKEAQYFVALLDRIFGQKLLGWRRLISSFGVVTGLFLLFFAWWNFSTHDCLNMECAIAIKFPDDISLYALAIVSFALSISLSRWISLKSIAISATYSVGPLMYVGLLLVHYVLFVVWRPLIDLLNGLLFSLQWNLLSWGTFLKAVLTSFDPWSDFLTSLPWTPRALLDEAVKNINLEGYTQPSDRIYGSLVVPTYCAASYFANAIRIVIALALLASFILREWLSHFASRLWIRIYEDNQGAFTLLGGGIGAVAGALKWLLGSA